MSIMYHDGNRQLQEAGTHLAERIRIACGEEAVRAFALRVVLVSLPGERLGNLARGFLRREHQGDVASKDTLKDRAHERIVRAAEDDGVDAGILQRCGIRPYGLGGLFAERIVALDQRHQPRAGNGRQLDARIECAHELRVPAGRNRALRRQQADPPVARRLHGRVRLGSDHTHDRHGKILLELR